MLLQLCGIRLKFGFLMLRPAAERWGHQLSLIQEMSFHLLWQGSSSPLRAVEVEDGAKGEVGPEGKVEGKLVEWCWLKRSWRQTSFPHNPA
jgi:hypothetical protein